MRRSWLCMLLAMFTVLCAVAQENANVDSDIESRLSTHTERTDTTETDTLSAPKDKGDNFFVRFIKQLLMGNKDKTFEKPIDMSYAVFPTYSKESSLGLGGMVQGLYRIDKRDSVLMPSDVKLQADVSLTGQYSVTVDGNNIFDRKQRLAYKLRYQSKPLDFWGISFDACSVNPESYYTRDGLDFEADYTYMVYSGIYVGCALDINYTFLSKIGDVSYLQGQKEAYYFTGIGVSFSYDTRNSVTNPTRGIRVLLKEVFYPQSLGTGGESIYSTTFIGNYYQKMWRGSTLALDLYGQYNGRNVPWTLRPELGEGSSRMRGFYRGRYIDNNMLSAQVEVRQHIYKRFGAVAWIGCGTVFPAFDELRWSDVLLNYGVGLRFEFKRNVNFRVDMGFGKDTEGFVITLSEAF